jgi:hypothetical protein
VEGDLLTSFVDFNTNNLLSVNEFPLLIVSVLYKETIAIFNKASRNSKDLVVEVVNV